MFINIKWLHVILCFYDYYYYDLFYLNFCKSKYKKQTQQIYINICVIQFEILIF